MATLTVGSGSSFEFNTLSSAIAASQDGDVIQVQAGTYTNDFATVKTKITIEGVGGMAHLVATLPPPNLKAILTTTTDATLYNMEFSGAAIPDADGGNGAGIRYEGGNLVLDHCYLHDNQDGLLAGADPTGTIAIKNSEFAFNGSDSGSNAGFTHNLYVGDIQQLTIDNSYFHDVIGGHEIKSRAENTTIRSSRVQDGPNGDGSYDVDLPNGGSAVISDTVIEKGPGSRNSNFIAYGEEGGAHANSALSVTGNTVINDKPPPVTFVLNQTAVPVSVTGNTFYGVTSEQVVSGPVALPESNTLQPGSSEPALDTSDPYLPVLPFSFACFAAGTRILTSQGELPVEALQVGQLVAAAPPQQDLGEDSAEAGPGTLCRIKWIGHRCVDLARDPDPRLARPVRIRRGAFSDDVPRRDLLLSPDHAVFVDGLLVPARLLQNGATILPDDGADTVLYFHVELDRHGILLAEGLPTESYLDTGNRSTFDNADAPVPLHPDLAAGDGQRRREALSCAPFAADAARVEPVWRQLAARAEQLGHVLPVPATTRDPALRISVNGREHRAVGVVHGRHRFVVPRSTGAVRLLSRATAPCDVTPWCEDRRRLGVAVERIVVTGAGSPVDMPVDHPSLTEGWAEVERDGPSQWRWTLGNALLALPPCVSVLEVWIVGDATYRLDLEEREPPPFRYGVAA